RAGEGLTERASAAIDPVAVLRRPAVDRDRLVLDDAVRGPAGSERGEIDEQLERRAGLPPRLGDAVERRLAIAPPADHRDDAAVGAHRDQRRLRPGRSAAHRPFGEALQGPVESRPDLHLAEVRRLRLLRVRRDPVGEIGAGRNVRGADDGPRGPGGLSARLADHAGIGHRLQHQLAAFLRGGKIMRRREARGRLDHSGEHRRLGEVEILGIAVEIMVRGGAQAIDSVAEIDAGQIAREDLLLGQPRLEPEGDDHLLRLALDRPVARQEVGLGELLGDRASALADAAAAEVGERRAGHSARVDSPMAVEAAVLDRHERRRSQRIEPGHVDRRLLDRAADRDRVPVVGQQQERRVLERLERSRQGRCEHKPDERDEDQRRDRIKIDRPAAPARLEVELELLVAGRSVRRPFRRERIGQLLDRNAAAGPDTVSFRHARTILRSHHCVTAVKQWRPYIQRLAEWTLERKPGRMRRLAALLALAALLGAASCREEPRGAVKVVVIGGAPQLRDPAVAGLSPPDEVLLANAAQGLVGFDASGNIVGGLAERWTVSDDGLSYIFRIASASWPDGRPITAEQVAHALKRAIAARSKDSLKDQFAAVEDIVAMTDRVIEISLTAPRPDLLALLAQPQMAILRGGEGTGPFRLAAAADGTFRLT